MGAWRCEELKMPGDRRVYCRVHTYKHNRKLKISESLGGYTPLHLVLNGKHLEMYGENLENLKRRVEAITELEK